MDGRGVQLDTSDKQLAWLRGELEGDYILPRFEPVWMAAAKIQLKGLPQFPGEPQTSPDAIQALDALAASLRNADPNPPTSETSSALREGEGPAPAPGRTPSASIAPETAPLASAYPTFGQLVRAAQAREEAAECNRRSMDRASAAGDRAAMRCLGPWLFSPKLLIDPEREPDIYRLQVLCDGRYGGTGLASVNLAQIRAEVCAKLSFPPEQVDSLPPGEVVRALQSQAPAPLPSIVDPENWTTS
jgi:hypothetical protein